MLSNLSLKVQQQVAPPLLRMGYMEGGREGRWLGRSVAEGGRKERGEVVVPPFHFLPLSISVVGWAAAALRSIWKLRGEEEGPAEIAGWKRWAPM